MLREVAEYPNCFGPLGPGPSERGRARHAGPVTQGGSMSRPILERLGFERVGEVHLLLDVFAGG